MARLTRSRKETGPSKEEVTKKMKTEEFVIVNSSTSTLDDGPGNDKEDNKLEQLKVNGIANGNDGNATVLQPVEPTDTAPKVTMNTQKQPNEAEPKINVVDQLPGVQPNEETKKSTAGRTEGIDILMQAIEQAEVEANEETKKAVTTVVDADIVTETNDLGEPVSAKIANLVAWTEIHVLSNDSKFFKILDSVPIQQIVEKGVYDRICRYERAQGEDYTLENLALITDTSSYSVSDGMIRRGDRASAVRFFLVGVVTHDANLRGDPATLMHGRRNLFLKPSSYSWGRASSVIGQLFEVNHIFGYIFGEGLAFSTLAITKREPKPQPKNLPSLRRGSTAVAKTRARDDVLAPQSCVPIYDGRFLEFNPKNFRRLPIYDEREDVKRGNIVMVIFTMGSYKRTEGLCLSLNIQHVVILNDNENDAEETDGGLTEVDGQIALPFVGVD